MSFEHGGRGSFQVGASGHVRFGYRSLFLQFREIQGNGDCNARLLQTA